MLLIFDLDDTLIPTSREITPLILELALKRMIEHGLEVDYEEGRKLILSMNQRVARSKEAVERFCEEVNGDPVYTQVGLKALEEEVGMIEVKGKGAVNAFLKQLTSQHKLAIVTGGNKARQNEKIDLYGLDRTLFEEIIVSNWGEKELAYAQLQDQFGHFLVVGDRIENDLSSAKKLGGITVHIRQGRGELEMRNHPDVDFEIQTINELTEVLRTYDNK